jgi:hypothetical protein
MSVLRTRSWPWFALAFALVSVGLVLTGPAGGVLLFLASMSLIGACMRKLRGTVHDVEGMEKVGAGIGVGGG